MRSRELVLRADGDGWHLLREGYTLVVFSRADYARFWMERCGYRFDRREGHDEVWVYRF